jgi:enoyl-CoA hydratase/carnithine racemase
MKNLSYHQGQLCLQRADKLNCLNHDLILEMNKALDLALADEKVKNVFLSGEGKAFCAGGDVVALVKNLQNAPEEAISFFSIEYELDYRLATLNKPLVVLAHGAVMGGGLGLYQGAQKKILDPGAILAMPEITIGLFPDVGATYFLNRLPSFWGMLVGITGMRISAGVAKLLGFADHLIAQESWPEVTSKLQIDLHQDLSSFEVAPTQEDKNFISLIEEALKDSIDWSDLNSFDHFARSFKGFAPLERAFSQYTHGSPSSAAVIHHQLKNGREFSLKQAYDQDLIMAKNFLQKTDFFEGVRALLIDKDKNPHWRPATLREINKKEILSYFQA